MVFDIVNPRNSTILCGISVGFLILAVTQTIAAFYTNTLSLLGDAFFMLLDVITYIAALYVESLANSKRNELTVTFFSLLILATLTAYVTYLAITRLLSGYVELDEGHTWIIFGFG